jgi:hypothetical protein
MCKVDSCCWKSRSGDGGPPEGAILTGGGMTVENIGFGKGDWIREFHALRTACLSIWITKHWNGMMD